MVMNKEELKELVVELEKEVIEMCEIMLWMESKFSRGKSFKKSRKEILMDILLGGKSWSNKDLSEEMSKVCGVEISRRNVSSLLCYLRDDFDKDDKYDLVKIGRGNGKNKLIVS